MEQEKGILDEQADVAWANIKAADLAQESSRQFAAGNTQEGLKHAQEAREAARLVEAIHDLYNITRIGRHRLGLPEFHTPNMSVYGEAPQPEPSQKPEIPGLLTLSPNLQKLALAMQDLQSENNNSPLTKAEIAAYSDINEDNVASYISMLNRKAASLPFSIKPIPQTLPEGQRGGKAPVKYLLEVKSPPKIMATNPNWVDKFKNNISLDMPDLSRHIEEGENQKLILTPPEKYRLAQMLVSLTPNQLREAGLALPEREKVIVIEIMNKLKLTDENIAEKSEKVGESLKEKLSSDGKKLYTANNSDGDAQDLITYAGYTGRPESEIKIKTLFKLAPLIDF